MTQLKDIPWWALIVGDFLTMVVFVTVLWWMGAPDWALVLAMLISTRTSSVHTQWDRLAIQTTLRNVSVGLELLCRIVGGERDEKKKG